MLAGWAGDPRSYATSPQGDASSGRPVGWGEHRGQLGRLRFNWLFSCVCQCRVKCRGRCRCRDPRGAVRACVSGVELDLECDTDSLTMRECVARLVRLRLSGLWHCALCAAFPCPAAVYRLHAPASLTRTPVLTHSHASPFSPDDRLVIALSRTRCTRREGRMGMRVPGLAWERRWSSPWSA